MAFSMKQNDTSPAIAAYLLDQDENPIDLTACTVRFIMRKRGETNYKVYQTVTIVDEDTGRIRYNWDAADTDEAGTFDAEFEVTYSDGTIETFPNDTYVTVNILDDLG